MTFWDTDDGQHDDSLTKRQREYREYLESSHWRTVRRAALKRAEHRCQVCNSAKALDVHHRTYERLGEEHDADLTVLCRRCHDLFHSTSKLKRPHTHKHKRVCQCGCGTPVKRKYAPGHYPSQQKAATRRLERQRRGATVTQQRRQEVWDAVVNQRST